MLSLRCGTIHLMTLCTWYPQRGSLTQPFAPRRSQSCHHLPCERTLRQFLVLTMMFSGRSWTLGFRYHGSSLAWFSTSCSGFYIGARQPCLLDGGSRQCPCCTMSTGQPLALFLAASYLLWRFLVDCSWAACCGPGGALSTLLRRFWVHGSEHRFLFRLDIFVSVPT